jgi:hypothetical protein
VALVAAAAVACGPAPPPRIVDDTERGFRYVPPPGWVVLAGELQSRSRSLVTIRVFDLEGAERRFLAGLPESIVPQLEEWAKSYYIVDGPPERSEATIGGQSALELTYPVRARADRPQSKLKYWVVRNADRLYVIRVALSPTGLAADEPAVRAMLATWEFTG